MTQHFYDLAQTWLLYALIAVAFHLGSLSCRHFNFVTALAFLTTPVLVAAIRPFSTALALSGGLFAVGVMGVGYRRLSAGLFRGGAREGQLLIVSLATLTIGENVMVATQHVASISLVPSEASNLIALGPILTSAPQVVVLGLGAAMILGIAIAFGRTRLGRAARALRESPLNLSLRGFSVSKLEDLLAASAFVIAGFAGVLWAVIARVRPAMGLEVAVIGVTAGIIAPMLTTSVIGLIGAALALAAIRLVLTLRYAGDWSTTAVFFLLLSTILVQKGRSMLAPRSRSTTSSA